MPDWGALLRTIPALDESLGEVVQQFGVWAYVALFVATFVKTGLIYVPMVPTTTLLFAAGVLASPQVKGLNPVTSLAVLLVAAILGDFANYGWGRIFGERLAKAPCAKRLKLDQITKAEEAFERYGLNTFLLARWVSVLRSTVPFVAGSSRYSATKFLLLNSVACLLWVGVIFGAGYVLGESNQVRSLMGIIAGSIIVVLAGPLIFRIVRDRKRQTPQANVPVSDTDSPSAP